MKETIIANMADGPQLYSFRHKLFFYGAYRVLEFTEQDRGRQLKVTVDAERPICWIELWPSAYDGKDWVRWTTDRGGETPLVRTGDRPQKNPSFTWTIQPGFYTLYFVNSNTVREPRKDLVTYHLEVL
jgi:hypothetical protein